MNTITIELCAEDRARLDKLTAALELRAKQETPSLEAKQTKPAKKKGTAPTETPAEAANDPAPITNTPEEEKPMIMTTAPAEKAAPAVTLEQIQQKIVQLCAGFGGAKKAQVRAIITEYGTRVSDLKDQPDKWDEVWGKLTALESEG